MVQPIFNLSSTSLHPLPHPTTSAPPPHQPTTVPTPPPRHLTTPPPSRLQYTLLDLETRVALGELLCGLALESHRLRAHVNNSVTALQILGRCRNAELAKLGKMNDASGGGGDKEARKAMTRKYATIRGLLGSYRRTPLGVDRDGREYFVLGEQWSRIFVCEPPPKVSWALRVLLLWRARAWDVFLMMPCYPRSIRITTHDSPLTTHHSPLTTHDSRLTTHDSRLTTRHSPTTTHKGRCRE